MFATLRWKPKSATAVEAASAVEAPISALQIAAWVGLLLLAALLYALKFNAFQLGTQVDDAFYVILARSLVSSPVYGLINTPLAPTPSKFPFVLPLLLTPWVRLFPERLDLFPITSFLATLTNAALLFWGWHWLVRGKSRWWGLAVTGLYLLSPLALSQSLKVMADPLFTTCCLGAILLGERLLRGAAGRWWSTLMALSLLGMAYTRSIGMVMAGLLVLYLLVRTSLRHWKKWLSAAAQAGALLALLVLLTPVGVRDLLPLEYLKDKNARALLAFLPADITSDTPELGPAEPAPDALPEPAPTPQAAPTIADRLGSIGRTLSFGVRHHLGVDLRGLALPIGGGQREAQVFERLGLPDFPMVIGYLVSALVIFGAVWLAARNGVTVFLVFAFLYFPVIFLWMWIGPRMMYPIAPQVFLGLLTGAEALILLAGRLLRALFRPKPAQPRLGWSGLLLAAFTLVLLAASIQKGLAFDDSRHHAGDFRTRSAWVRANAAPGDVLMSEAAEVDYLYSGLKTVSYPIGLESPDQLARELAVHGVDWVLVSPQIRWQTAYKPQYSDTAQDFLPLLESLAAQGKLKLVYQSEAESTQVFRVLPTPGQ